MPDPFPSFCSTPPPTTPNSLLVTGISRPSCTTSPAGMLFGRTLLNHLLLLTGCEPKTCINVSSEQTPINHPSRNQLQHRERLTTTVAASPAASGSPQPVPASVVNPWLSGDMWSSTTKQVRSNASIARVERILSGGKQDRDLENAQTVSERQTLQVYLELKAQSAVAEQRGVRIPQQCTLCE